MKNCPACKAPVDGLVCQACGTRDPNAPPEAQSKPQMDRLCSDVTRGQRCAKVGSFSHSTTGSGPWLCWDHFSPNATRYVDGVRSGPPGGFTALKAKLAKAAPAKPDFELEAERAAIRADH